MEIDENIDSKPDVTKSAQISQEMENKRAQILELQIGFDLKSRQRFVRRRLQVSNLQMRRRCLSDCRRIRRAGFDHPIPELSHSGDPIPQLSHSGERSPSSGKTHISRFQKREITTIPEEVFQFIKPPRNPFAGIAPQDRVGAFKCTKRSRNSLVGIKSKSKDYKEKVASLKLFIDRLQMSSLSKTSTLQNNIPDETIQLFERIHI